MGAQSVQTAERKAWKLIRRQHGVITRAQLIEYGYTPKAIDHRLRRGRLRAIHCAVYAVGHLDLTRHGRWMAAVLAAGEGAVLSHLSAAALWQLTKPHRPRRAGYSARPSGESGGASDVEVSVPPPRYPRIPRLVIHRRQLNKGDITRRDAIPVTTTIRTLLDLASRFSLPQLEAAINSADKLDLIHPPQLRRELARRRGQPGVGVLRKLLDRQTFALTDSELERRFLRLVRRAGLPRPRTGARLNGFKVDFFWPEFGLVVETDGLRYHRTAAQQARDRRRDQAHTAAGLTTLRFTHAQVFYEPEDVEMTLAAVAASGRTAA